MQTKAFALCSKKNAFNVWRPKHYSLETGSERTAKFKLMQTKAFALCSKKNAKSQIKQNKLYKIYGRMFTFMQGFKSVLWMTAKSNPSSKF